MPFAAVPDYLGRDYSTAAPGHRFYLYFEAWEKDGTGKLVKIRDKTAAVKKSLSLNVNDRNAIAALAARQRLMASERVWQLPAQTVAPLTTGLGMEHPLENGFAFLSPYGLPYLAGNGIKGVLRQAARELRDDDPGAGWDDVSIDAMFGPDTGDEARRGALIFWDAYPIVAQSLMAEVMTPHQTHYYRDRQAPHDSGQPNPILFLAIPPKTPLTFYVDCNHRLLPDVLRDNDAWQTLLRAAFEYAFDWLGFGAKTAVGYGHVEIDTGELERQEEKQREQQAEHATQERIQQATHNLPADASWLEERIQRGAWPDNAAFLDDMAHWLDNAELDALSPEAWQRIETEMAGRYDQNLLVDPDATKGKKNKPKYKDRPKTLAKRLIELKPEGNPS